MVRNCLNIVVLCICISPGLSGQQGGFEVPQDTVPEIDIETVPREKARLFSGRPGRAALYSLILPGAGQAYNKKYWQVPVVWAAVGGVGYIMATNVKDYKGYRDQYAEFLIAEMEGREPVLDPNYGMQNENRPYTKDQTRNLRNAQNRYRQLSIIGFAAVWIANSAQAYVSGHLLEFDIDDDLSLEVIPMQYQKSDLAIGLAGPSVVLKF